MTKLDVGWQVVTTATLDRLLWDGVLRCDVVSLGKWLTTFRSNLVYLVSMIFHEEWLADNH